MSIDKYRFVSPGVQVAEIDLSRRTRPSAEPGPVIIGRFERGPTMVPTRVESLAELEELFGKAITGRESGDISRNGNKSAPSYAAFAANAWLANQPGATIVRLVGKKSDDAQTGGEAGCGGHRRSARRGRQPACRHRSAPEHRFRALHLRPRHPPGRAGDGASSGAAFHHAAGDAGGAATRRRSRGDR